MAREEYEKKGTCTGEQSESFLFPEALRLDAERSDPVSGTRGNQGKAHPEMSGEAGREQAKRDSCQGLPRIQSCGLGVADCFGRGHGPGQLHRLYLAGVLLFLRACIVQMPSSSRQFQSLCINLLSCPKSCRASFGAHQSVIGHLLPHEKNNFFSYSC